MSTKKTPEHPITPEQVEEFARLLKVWQERLHLTSWRVAKGRRRPTASLAEVEMFPDDRLARVHVGRDWGANPGNMEDLEKVVIHELLHILLFDLARLAEYGEGAPAVAGVEHAIIVPLTETLHKLTKQ
jgi:hypothetical protein